MIPNYWYPIFDARALRRRPVAVTRFGLGMVLWRGPDGRAIAMPDRCSHRAERLSRGRIRDGCLECPYHGLRFDRSGRCVLIPANGAGAPVPRGFDLAPFPIREQHGLIWYWYGERPAGDELPWPAGAYENSGRTATRTALVALPFLRVMENMLDFHHIPFVHRWTAPGFGPRIDDYQAVEQGEEISVSATYRHEGPPSIFKPTASISATARFPSMVLIREMPGLYLLTGFTPVDDGHCWMWMRYRQEYLPGWLGGRLAAALAGLFDYGLVFRMGDVPTMMGQSDPPGDLSGYHLYEADRGIGLYFGKAKRALEHPAAPARHFSGVHSAAASAARD